MKGQQQQRPQIPTNIDSKKTMNAQMAQILKLFSIVPFLFSNLPPGPNEEVAAIGAAYKAPKDGSTFPPFTSTPLAIGKTPAVKLPALLAKIGVKATTGMAAAANLALFAAKAFSKLELVSLVLESLDKFKAAAPSPAAPNPATAKPSSWESLLSL